MNCKIFLVLIIGITCLNSCKKTKESLSNVPGSVIEDGREIANQSKQELEKSKEIVLDKTKKIVAPALEKLHETAPKLKNAEASKLMIDYALLVSQLFATTNDESHDSTQTQLKVAQKLKELLTVMQNLDKTEKQKITDWLNKLPELTGATDFY